MILRLNAGTKTLYFLVLSFKYNLIYEKYKYQNIINYSHLKEGLFYPGSATKSCAASITWFRNAFGRNYDYLSEISKKAPIGSEGLIFHPYLTGELTPLANPNIRGNFFGVSSCHKEEHFIRSVVEGISFSICDCLIYLKEHGIKVGKTAYFLGGLSKNKFCKIFHIYK